MSKIRNFIEEQKTDLKGLLFNYTFTLIAAALLSVVVCIELELEKNSDAITNIELFLAMFLAGALFIETYFVNNGEEKKWGKLALLYIGNAILSVIWTVIGYYEDEIADSFNYPDLFYLNLSKVLAVYLAALIGLSIYKLVKKSGLSFDIYLARAIFGLLKMWGLFFVIYMALMMLLSIFDSLIFEIEYWDIIDNLSVLLCGFVCFPYSIQSITDTKEENSRFTKGLINFALMPAVMIAFVIIYIYIIKIIIGWEMPSNEAFDICLTLFIMGGPIWLISYGFLREKAKATGEELGLYGKIAKNMKYAYIPFIILEIVAIGIRIYHYGLTNQRYLAVVAIVFQIAYVAWDGIGKLSKKETKDEGLILVGLGIVVFVLFCPILNMNKLPALVQQARFEKAIEEERYGDASEIFYYLNYDEYGDKYLDEKYTEAERKEYHQMFYDTATEEEKNSYKYVEHYSCYVPYDNNLNGLEIAGYTHIYKFVFDGHYDKIYTKDELSAFTVFYGDNFQVSNVDFTPIMYEIIEKKDTSGDWNQMDYKYIKLGNNCCVVVEDIRFKYNTIEDEFSDVEIDGYVLTNEGAHNGQ